LLIALARAMKCGAYKMFEILIAWLLPLLAGMGLWQMALGRARGPTQWAGVVGYGYLVGMLLAGALTAALCWGDTRHALRDAGPALAMIAVIGWAWSWKSGVTKAALPSYAPLRSWHRLMFFFLIALLLIRAFVLLDEVWLRPTFPWDAWAAWAVKPKSWYLLGYGEKYVSASVWLAQTDSALRTTATWHYPTLLGWMQVWFASAAGQWNEPMVNLPWVGIWIALLLATYAQLRELGSVPLRAMLATYALGSLPLLNAHVALAGYADLWLAALFGMAVLVWLLWLQQRRSMQLIAALALGLFLPALKLEGTVWMGCFFSIVFLATLPARPRKWLIIAMILISILGLAIGGFELPLPGLGLVRIAWGEIDIPAMGTLLLQWHSVGHEMFATLYSLPNWHLLWFLAPLIIVLRWREFLRHENIQLLGWLLLLCGLFLFVLFFYTEASRWAEDFTSANRLIMHITPVVITLLALLLRDAGINQTPHEAHG
jgi:hypothetical protein